MATPEDSFLNGLLELQYGSANIPEMRNLANYISWARGWPGDARAFWNAEAFMWSRKIEKETRDFIGRELSFLSGKRNLDLGCGAYSYLPSVGFDLSEKMLAFNEKCFEKIVGDVERPLPFSNVQFDSVTAVFLLNYIVNYQQLFREVWRVLVEKGVFVVILSEKPINCWQRQKEINLFSGDQWKHCLQKVGFTVVLKAKESLLFFMCTKRLSRKSPPGQEVMQKISRCKTSLAQRSSDFSGVQELQSNSSDFRAPFSTTILN